MSEETKMVLQMLSDGKITADQAANLLQALSLKSPVQVRLPHSEDDLREAVRKGRQEAKEAARAAKEELREAKRVAKDAVREAKERLREEKTALRERLRSMREEIEENDDDLSEELEDHAEELLDELECRGEELEEIEEETEHECEHRRDPRGGALERLGSVLGGLWGLGRLHTWAETHRGEFAGAGPREVNIHGVNGRITLEPSDSNQWELSATKALTASSEAEAKRLAEGIYSLESTGQSLTVRAKKVFGQSQSVHFHLRLPREGQYNIDLRCTNGSVQVQGVNAHHLKAATTNGKVVVKSRAQEMELTSTNGRVELSGCAEKVRCRTVNGRIAIECPEVQPGTMDLVTVNGQITARIKQDAKLGVQFTGSSVTGSLSSNLRGQVITNNERRSLGRKLVLEIPGSPGSSLSISAKSVHGSISLTEYKEGVE